MNCRLGCGACCIAPSISSPIQGKPAGVRCIQLDAQNLCKIFGHPGRPKVCGSLQPEQRMCGNNNAAAFDYLNELEKLTS